MYEGARLRAIIKLCIYERKKIEQQRYRYKSLQ